MIVCAAGGIEIRVGSYTSTNSLPSGVYPFDNDATNAGICSYFSAQQGFEMKQPNNGTQVSTSDSSTNASV